MPIAQLRKYGPTGVGVYLALSFSVWTCFFVALENHLDLDSVIKSIWGEGVDSKEVLKRWGLKKDDPEASWLMQKAPSAVLALAASKTLVPIKLPIAAGLTPYVHRLLTGRGYIK